MCIMYVHAQKIAKLFFSVRSTQFPFKLNLLFKKKYINLLGPCAKKKKIYYIQEIEPTHNTHHHHSPAITAVGMHVIMFCDGPCNESVWRSGATADKSQWWSRHDAIVRTTAATLWRSSTHRHQQTKSMHIFFSDNNEKKIVCFSFHY